MRKTCHIHRGRPTAFADNGSGGVPGPNNLFITSAVEHPDGNVTLPLHRGTSNGQTVST